MSLGDRRTVSSANPDDVAEGMVPWYPAPGADPVLDHGTNHGSHAGAAAARLTAQEGAAATRKGQVEAFHGDSVIT
jgi:hypothetical protein